MRYICGFIAGAGYALAYALSKKESMSEVTGEQHSTVLGGIEGLGAAGGSDRLVGAVRKRWKLFAGIALVITLAIGAAYWYVNQQEERNTEAATALSRVRPYFVDGMFQQALTGDSIPQVGDNKVMGLLEISDQYSGTDAGSVAALLAGNALANLGRYSEAREQFDRASANSSQLTQVGAMQGLAVCMEAEGNVAGAAEQYQNAAQKAAGSAFESQCTFMSGLCYEKSGNTAKAGEMYRLVVKKLEGSAFSSAARSGLARLGMAID